MSLVGNLIKWHESSRRKSKQLVAWSAYSVKPPNFKYTYTQIVIFVVFWVPMYFILLVFKYYYYLKEILFIYIIYYISGTYNYVYYEK